MHGTPAWIASGSNHGLLKSYVESFLMQDGLPWYAASSAAPYKGDATLDDVKANRDNRLQLFMFGESNFCTSIFDRGTGHCENVCSASCI